MSEGINRRSAVRVREVADCDTNAMAEVLARTFNFPVEVYSQIFQILRKRPAPEGYPRYGYLMEAGESIVGGIILIFSRRSDESKSIRCHVTGWFVHEEYRSYAALFVSKALRFKGVTYLNLSASPETVPIIYAQGFSKYSAGQFVAIPATSFLHRQTKIKIAVRIAKSPEGQFEQYERDLLLAHESHGCVCFWCITPEGSYPFAFQRRTLMGLVRGLQLIYCRDIGDLVRFARPIGLHLALRGRFVICIDANGIIPNLTGKYFDGVQPRYYKGDQPKLGDLAYTLPALFPPYYGGAPRVNKLVPTNQIKRAARIAERFNLKWIGVGSRSR